MNVCVEWGEGKVRLQGTETCVMTVLGSERLKDKKKKRVAEIKGGGH